MKHLQTFALTLLVVVVLALAIWRPPENHGQVAEGEVLLVREWDGCNLMGYLPTYRLAIKLRCLVDKSESPLEINGPATVIFPLHLDGGREVVTSRTIHDCGGKKYILASTAPNIAWIVKKNYNRPFYIQEVIIGGGKYRLMTKLPSP